MKKMKLYVPLFVALFVGMTGSAFAQLSCNVASTPVSRAISTGHAEQAGDLIFNCTGGGGPTTAATITVGYGVVITNNVTIPGGAGSIAVSGATGSFAAAGSPTVTNASVSNATGQVVLSVPAQGAAAAGSFSLTGVRVSLNGTGLTSLTANVSVSPGSGVLITAGQNVATVITAILPGINTTTAPPALVGLSALYFSSSAAAVPGRGAFTFTVTENFIDAFRDVTQITGASNDTQLLVTFAGLPTGTSIGTCTATITAGFTTLTVNGVAGAGGGTATAAAPTLTLDFVGATNATAIETVTVVCASFAAPVAALPLSATITATVTLSPVSTALTAAGAVIPVATHFIPRFASSTSSLGTVLSFTPNTTTMIIPYALGDPSLTAAAGTFDTGIAIANTSSDVVGAASIFTTGGAVAQAGTITFYFFPGSGTAADRFSVTTASVGAGASFVSLVSEILRGAGRTTTFSGYIIAVANFTNAHGSAFVFGGGSASRLTSATDVLVIPSPIAAARTATGGVGALVEATSK